ncbi:hypothetical protein ACP275_06G012900 [Erythranthe tilingii]
MSPKPVKRRRFTVFIPFCCTIFFSFPFSFHLRQARGAPTIFPFLLSCNFRPQIFIPLQSSRLHSLTGGRTCILVSRIFEIYNFCRFVFLVACLRFPPNGHRRHHRRPAAVGTVWLKGSEV